MTAATSLTNRAQIQASRMSIKLKVGSPGLTLHQGYAVGAYGRDGQITEKEGGIFFHDTRLISRWEIFVNGARWTFLNSGDLSHSAGRSYFTNPELRTDSGTIPEATVGMMLTRHLEGGLHEDVDITNYGTDPVHILLEISALGDFADIFEVKSHNVIIRGAPQSHWDDDAQCFVTQYRNKDFSRAFRISSKRSASKMACTNGKLGFYLGIKPRAQWHTCLLYDFADGDSWSLAPNTCAQAQNIENQQQKKWREHIVRLQCNDRRFEDCFTQALDDLAALRLPIEGTDQIRFVPAAGLPWFVALFGRDSLVTSLQTTIVHPEYAIGALRVLAKFQAREIDDYTDAEPGKILHELRRGELAHFHLIPHTPYYGTADATPLYLITLHSAFMCTGDRGLLSEHLHTAERALEWIDKFGDRDGDGFQEYQTRSSAGYENLSWKDSGEAIVYEDGTNVKGPKALCELQGYVYDAWLRMAAVYDVLGNPGRADELRNKAAQLFLRFNERFWDERDGYYALTLDGDKKPVFSVASNPGHCLWSGIVPPERATRVVERLFQQDMWSGWGIRTLSANHKSFNPYRYQVGSVWPHDNGLIALGMKRYGFDHQVCKIAEAITASATVFEKDQIPELYAGIQRETNNFPVQYKGANVPQAWAAGSIFSILQALIGYQPDAPNNRLYLDPSLPDWMPRLRLRRLKMGRHEFDIDFLRDGIDSRFKVLNGPAKLVAARPMRSWFAELTGRS